MNVKLAVITIYLVLIYWLSSHVPMLEPLFYPTLGAFSYLLVSRTMNLKESASIMAGAVFASITGTAFFFWLPETLSLLATFVLCIIMIQRFRLNAPPILAIALIPFFEPPATPWTIPLVVFATLTALLVTLFAVERAAGAWTSLQRSNRGPGGAQQKDAILSE
ncbi:HPP family protein [Paenibacillus antri]|nr:HPP family protein [Paenibacillus antri]